MSNCCRELESPVRPELRDGEKERECLHPLLPHLPFSPPFSFPLVILFDVAFSVAAPLKHLDRSGIGKQYGDGDRIRERSDGEMTEEHAEAVGGD